MSLPGYIDPGPSGIDIPKPPVTDGRRDILDHWE
jgi:hypothetical protein